MVLRVRGPSVAQGMTFTLVQCVAMTLAPTDLMYLNEWCQRDTQKHNTVRASVEIFRAGKN